MDREEKIAELMRKSRQVFIYEEQERLNQIMITLLDYRLNRTLEEGRELERFFHSLKGTGATLELEGLSSIGEDYEDFISTVNESNGLSEDVFLRILDGLARVHENLKELSREDNENEEPNAQSYCDEEPHKDTASKVNILILDDVGIIVHLMQSHLDALGYCVSSAKDGEEGIRKCRDLKPDLMIVDLMLPKVDGYEVCRQIKENPETKDTKIVIVSAKNKKEDVLRCFELGVDDYMIKPFSMQELEQRIKKLL